TLKVRLPLITGNDISELSVYSDRYRGLHAGGNRNHGLQAANLMQCIRRARLRLVQVMFNVAAVALSIAVAYQGSVFVLALTRADSVSALLALAACPVFRQQYVTDFWRAMPPQAARVGALRILSQVPAHSDPPACATVG
ncbi:MAG TPA: hypothetical protein VNH18_27945, partial [Bryobacteraceae bacterium]|nr:hypothetical protein [Bryobacteraceae bacterium]